MKQIHIGVLHVLWMICGCVNARNLYMDSAAHCGQTYQVDDTDVFMIQPRGDVDVLSVPTSCRIEFQSMNSSRNHRFEIVVQAANFRDCGTTLQVIDGKTADNQVMKMLGCGSSEPTGTIFSLKDSITLLLTRLEPQLYPGITFQLKIQLYQDFSQGDFSTIVDDFWKWRMKNNPEFASNVGDQSYTEYVEDYSMSAIDSRKSDMDKFMRRLRGVDKSTLPREDVVTYDVIVDTIQTWLDGYKWKDYGPMNPINILEGIYSSLGSKAGQVKFLKEDDFRKFAYRIGRFGEQITQMYGRMDRAIAMNTTNHLASIEGVPEKIQTNLLDKYYNNPMAMPLYEPFNETLDRVVTNETIKGELRDLAVQKIVSLQKELGILKNYLNDTYIPSTRTSFGVWGLPRGEEYYAACLKWQLSVNWTADEIYEIGIREVNRVYGEMEKIVRKAGFKGTVKEYNDYLRNKSELFIDDPDEAMDMFKTIHADRIVPKLSRMFKDIPDVPLEIKKSTNNGPSGIYKNAAPDGSRPGVFYANVNSPVPKFDLLALLLHESDPGHHLQDAYALTARGIPMFRKATDFSKYFAVPLHFPFYTSYSEGWALYAEDLGESLNIYENDMERFGKLSLEIFRAARLVVDTGIHAKKWSQQQAIDYMSNYTAYKLGHITREINRYATWPGQATTYMVGKLVIQDLKEYATTKLCAKFDIKEFHNVLLANGAMPLSVMEQLVEDWVNKVREDNNLTGNDCSRTWTNRTGTMHGTSWVLALMLYLALCLY